MEPTFAGVRRHLVDLVLGLQQSEGDSVEQHLLYSGLRADATFAAQLPILEAAGVTTRELEIHRGIDPRTDFRAAIETARYIRRTNIRIVHCHSAKAGFIGRFIARTLPGVASVYTPNASPFRISSTYRLLEQLSGYLLSDLVIAVSESEADELRENHIVPARRIRVVYSGIPDSDRAVRGLAASGDINESRTTCTIGTVGRISEQKSPLLFSAIVDEMTVVDPSLHFVWIGDGEMRAELEADLRLRGVSDHVTITGWVDDIEAEYDRLDIFLLASAYESFGYGTVEAMRAGLPVVVSSVPGSVDVVEDSITGFIVPGFSEGGYAEAIQRLVDDPALRTSMGQRGQERWRDRFHRDKMVKGTLDVYRELASMSGGWRSVST